MTQKEALLKAIRIWGDVAFAKRDGSFCFVGYTSECKLVSMGYGISWEKAFKRYDNGRVARYEAAF